MNRPTWWLRIGGDNALSRWSAIITLPCGIALALSSAGPVARMGPWLAAVVLVHLAAGAVLALAYLTVLHPGHRPPRTLVALATFAAAGVTRGLLLTWAHRLTDVADPLDLSERILGNAVLAVIVLSLIAVAVDSSRQHTRLMTELLVAQRTLDALSAAGAEELRRIDGEVERHLSVTLATAPERSPGGQGAWLLECAEAVRRASHDLDRGATGTLPLPPVEEPRPWERISPLLARMRPCPPLLCALIIEIAPLGGVASQCGWPVATFNAIVGGALLVGLAEFISRWYRPVARGALNLLLLTAAYSVAGLVAITVTRTLGSLIRLEVPFFALGIPYIVGVALGLSLVAAVQAGYTADLQRREEAVRAAAQRADANAQEVHARRRTLAALLHGPVQGEFLRAAAQNTDPGRVGERVRSLLAEPGDPVPARQEVSDVTGAWGSVLDLTVDVAEAVWPVLDALPGARQAVIDVLSEGLANAVRHGSGSKASVRLALLDDEVTVEITSCGVLVDRREPGLGSAILGRRCRSWAVDTDGTSVRLVARVAAPSDGMRDTEADGRTPQAAPVRG